MAEELKILFVGPRGAGKSTAIKTLSSAVSDRAEFPNAANQEAYFALPAVPSQYGRLWLPDGNQVQVYEMPDLRDFEFMRETLTHDAHGLVLMIDASAPNPAEELKFHCSKYQRFIERGCLLVALTHADALDTSLVKTLQTNWQRQLISCVVMAVDPRHPIQMLMLLETLLAARNAYGDAARYLHTDYSYLQ